MAITDIQISEELETNAPSIKYRGDEGPKSPQEMQEMMMSGGQPLPDDPTKPVNPFAPKPTGPTLPNKMAFDDTPGFELEDLKLLIDEFELDNGRPPISIDDLKRYFYIKYGKDRLSEVEETVSDRQMAAYGGIMGLDGRKQYGVGSWLQKAKDYAEGYITGKTQIEIENESQARVDREQGINRPIPEGYDLKTQKIADITPIGDPEGKYGPQEGYFDTLFKGERDDKGVRQGGLNEQIVPIVGGALAGLFTKGTDPDNPGLPSDTTALALDDLKKSANILDQQAGIAAGLNFLPAVEARKYTPAQMLETYQNAANGGRIGYTEGNAVIDYENDPNYQGWKKIYEINPDAASMNEKHKTYKNYYMSKNNMKAEGGLMDLGGMEKDYRAEGGFVPIGKQEKADDVPARLCVNEFVFTADAVRNAGGGDIDKGAEVMENMMKHLEAGGQVSEESQGMAGARDMFATSQRLGDVV